MTAETADTGGGAGGDTPGGGGGGATGSGARWAPGTQVLWRYRAGGAAQPHICRPVTVVRDTPELLAAWVAPGTLCARPEMADGTPLHREPLATRYTKPHAVTFSHWFGTGVLKLARPGDPWSVWLFWEQGWRFKNFYVNLEQPHRRWPGGIDSDDHFLDIEVHPDRTWVWRDEDEFAEAQRAGLMSAATAERVREAGRAAVAEIRAWRRPFCDGWERWRPDPRWPVPGLPEDWAERPAARAPAGRSGRLRTSG